VLRTEPLVVHRDDRGDLVKAHPAPVVGEVYVVTAHPGQARGHHYHRHMAEWFVAVAGQGEIRAQDPATGETARVSLDGLRVQVPAGIAHVLVNTGTDELVVVACAERLHDPEDVVAWPVPL
jgi:oxalate decarboxylase/phosphoglucose isomerase-like protein (cupin superfamily)